MRAEVGFDYKNADVKDYLDITRDILQQIISNKNKLKNLLRKKNELINSDLTKQINKNARIIDSINEIVKPELSFRYLFDINPPSSRELLINEATIGKTQCLADVGIFILTCEEFSEQFRIDLIEHTNITGFLSEQPAENMYVNENKIRIYLGEYFKNYRLFNNRYLPVPEVELQRNLYDIHINIYECIKSNLTKKMLYEKNLSVFEHNEEKFHGFIKGEVIRERLDNLNRIKKEVEDFFPLECFLNKQLSGGIIPAIL